MSPIARNPPHSLIRWKKSITPSLTNYVHFIIETRYGGYVILAEKENH